MGIALGAAGAVLGWLVVSSLLVGVWMGFTIRGLIRMTQGRGGPWASTMAQISVIAMLVGLLRFGPTWGILAVLFPPGLLIFVADIADLAITPQIAIIALPVAMAVLVVTLRRPAFRPFATGLTLLALVAATLTAGNVISVRAMCTAADAVGLTDITRNSFAWSVANTGHDFQFDLHAMARRGDDLFAWSYGTMDWYPLPDTIWPNVQSGATACAP